MIVGTSFNDIRWFKIVTLELKNIITFEEKVPLLWNYPLNTESVHLVWLKLRPNVSGGRLHLHHNTNYVSLALVHKLGLVVRNRITGVRGKWKISVFRRNKLITLYAEMKKIHNIFPETSPIKQFRKNSFDIFPNLIVTREWKHFLIYPLGAELCI